MSSTLTVWYNTKCPVCNAGIEWQHRRLVQAARAGVIEFHDINLEPDALSRFGAGVEDVRRRLLRHWQNRSRHVMCMRQMKKTQTGIIERSGRKLWIFRLLDCLSNDLGALTFGVFVTLGRSS